MQGLLRLALLAVGLAPSATALAQTLAPTLLDERCVLEQRDDVAPPPGLPGDQLIVCNGRTIGVLSAAQLLARTGMSPEQSVEASYRNSRASTLHRNELRCNDTMRPLSSPPARPVTALACRRTNGGWQHLVVMASDPESLRIADGPPSALPALLSAVTGASDSLGAQSAGEWLERLFGEKVPLASASDLDGFKTMVREARAANGLARYDEAERLFRRALALQSRLLSENDPAIAETLMDLALNVSNQGRDEEALALFRRAEPIIQRSPRPADRARFAAYQGYHAANFQRHEEALSFARAAVAGWRAQVDGPRVNLGGAGAVDAALALDRGELALALNLLASMALRLDELALAQASATEALQILNATEGLPRWWRPDVLLTLGRISSAQGRLSAAETFLSNSLEEQRQIAGDGPQTLAARVALATAYQVEGLHTAALVTYREIFALVRRLGPGAAASLGIEDLIPFGLSVTAYAEQLPDEAQRQGLYAEAFDAFQLIRPPLVEQTLLRTRERIAATRPGLADLLEKLRQAERQRSSTLLSLSFETSLPDDQRSRVAEERLNAEVGKAQREVDALSAELQNRFPDYRQLGAPAPLDSVELRRRLATNEAIVSFVVGRKRSLVQLIRRDGIQIRRVEASESGLGQTVASLRRSFEVGTSGLAEFDREASFKLHDTLFKSLEAQLQGIEHLVVIPSGPLASLPFALLITQPPPSSSTVEPAWLIRRMALSHVPSLRSFHLLRSTAAAARASDAMLGIGDPILTGQAAASAAGSGGRPASDAAAALASRCRQDGPADAESLRALAPLPDTATEIAAVAAVLARGGRKTTLLTRGEATETALRDQDLERFRVLYFATHGLLPGELRCQAEPGLVLTPNANATRREDDGLLEASEIATLKLNADLVVLSACNTAGFENRTGGDALSGLAEAFLLAGARGLLASHWQVSSTATTRLMTDLFSTLGPEISRGTAQALRRAQLTLSAQPATAHPFFWAAFTLIGDGIDERELPMPRSAVARQADSGSGSRS
jgi:CHAT domain-containing protein